MLVFFRREVIMRRFYFNRTTEKGQGLVEYSLILVFVAVVVISVLLTLGPQVGRVFSRVVTVLNLVDGGVISSVSAERTGGGNGNDVVVSITVSTNTSVTVDDSQSGQVKTATCNGSCSVTLTGVGDAAGTATVTADAGGTKAAGYPTKP